MKWLVLQALLLTRQEVFFSFFFVKAAHVCGFFFSCFFLNKGTNHSAYQKEVQGAVILQRVRTRSTLLFFTERVSQKQTENEATDQACEAIGIHWVLSSKDKGLGSTPFCDF